MLDDPQLIAANTVAALRIQEQPGRSIDDTLREHLQRRNLLLLLDGCEHVLDAVAGLATSILRTCPSVRILATSQARLGIAGEVAWLVPPLSIPDLEERSPERVATSEGARLFAERARAVAPGFVITKENAGAVARICHELDGIPLAIELAAARAGVLAPSMIAERLGDRLRLLRSGRRDTAQRHQTLRAAIEWSLQLLNQPEQTLFARLSVFFGGFTLEAAEAVCPGAGIDVDAVLDLLTALVDRSFVVVAPHGEIVRYRMLETVRRYGAERLRERGEEDDVLRRHCTYYTDYAERAEPQLRGSQQRLWFERLAADHNNCRAALDYAVRQRDTDLASRLASALWRFWFVRGHVREGYDRLRVVLGLPHGENVATRASLLNAAGVLALVTRDLEVAADYHEQSLALRRGLGDRGGVAASLSNLGIARLRRGDVAAAETLFTESLEIRREIGDDWGVATSLHNLGNAAYAHRDFVRARGLYMDAVTRFHGLEARHAAANVLIDLGNTAAKQGTYDEARAHYLESLGVLRDLGDRAYLADALEGMAKLAALQGRAAFGGRLMGAAAALRGVLGSPLPLIWERDHREAVESLKASLGGQAFEAEWAAGAAMPLGEAVAHAADSASGM
jgi:non-specific serine/threonine protein kinase